MILGLAGAIVSLSPYTILFCLVDLSPLIALYFAPYNYCIRLLNYIWHCAQMGLLVIILTVFLVREDVLIDKSCDAENIVAGESFSLADCEDIARVSIYWMWTIAALVCLPL